MDEEQKDNSQSEMVWNVLEAVVLGILAIGILVAISLGQ